MEQIVQDKYKVSAFMVFALIHGMQIGIGLLSFQREITKLVGFDAWIVIIFSGLLINFYIFLIYKICNTVEGGLITAHHYVFGNLFSKLFNSLFLGYFIMVAIMTLRAYIEIIEIWIFPDINITFFTMVVLLVIYYIVSSGFNVITGITLFGAIVPVPIYLVMISLYKHGNFRNLLPIMEHSTTDLFKSTMLISLSLLGFELLLMYYPFIKKPRQSEKWAHLAVITTTLVYTIFAVLTFGFFSEKQVEITIWPTLSMWKFIQLPLIERFEFIGVAIWFFMIIPNMALVFWAASRIIKHTFPIKQRSGLLIIIIILVISSFFLETIYEIDFIKKLVRYYGTLIVYMYIPILALLVTIKKRVKNR